MIDLTDEQLMERVKAGDVSPLGFLYERYKKLLFNYFLRVTSDYDSSNDLLMQTFERIHTYRKSFGGGKRFRPWLFQVANNLVKDHYRKAKRFVEGPGSNYETKVVEPRLEREQQERNDLLNIALQQLTMSERTIIQMYYLLEMSYTEISATENISVNSARIRICRGLKKLNTLLKNSGI